MNNKAIEYLMQFNKFTYDRLTELTELPRTTLHSIVKQGALGNSIERILRLSNAFKVPVNLIVEEDWIDPTSLDYQSNGIDHKGMAYWNIVTNHLLKSICREMRADFGWIALRDNRDNLIPEVLYGARNIPPMSVKKGITGHSVSHGATVLVDDVSDYPKYEECIPEVKSELCCPLVLYGKPIGVINLESKKVGRFSVDDAVRLKTFAHQIARALACSSTLSSTKFQEVGGRLNRLEYEGWRILADLLLEELRIDCGKSKDEFMLLVFMHDKAGLYCIVHKELGSSSKYSLHRVGDLYSERQLLPINSVTGEALISNREVYIGDISKEPRFSIAEELEDMKTIMKSMLVIPFPIMGNLEHPAGTLNVISVDRHTDFLDRRTNLRMYSELLSFAHLNAKIHKREAAFSVLGNAVNENSDKQFLDMLHETIIWEIAEIMGARAGSIFAAVEGKKGEIRCIATTGLEGYEDHAQAVYNEQKKGMTYEVIYKKRTPVRFFSGEGESKEMMSIAETKIRKQYNVEEPLYREKIVGVSQTYAASFLGVPIVIGDTSIGVIRLVSKKRGLIFAKDDEELLLDIASILAPAIMNEDINFLLKLL